MTGGLTGKIVVVTGASDGIGAAAVRQLAARGATVVVVGRSAGKTHAVADEIRAQRHVTDYADLGQVRGLAADLLARNDRIDVLINNVGFVAGSRTVTADGHETMFQVNHLAGFLLTHLLRDRLVASQGTVITTSSAANAQGVVDLEDLESEQTYGPFRTYSTTKLENILFTRELARRWGPDGVSAAAIHPGVVRTRFGSGSTRLIRLALASPLKYLLRSATKGANTLVWLAETKPGADWESGGYYFDRKLVKANPQADDADLAAGLWERSLAMI